MKTEKEAFDKKIGINVRRARLEANLTQDEMSEHLGLTRVSVLNIEKGRQALSTQKLVLVSQITGISVTSIIGDMVKELPKRKKLELPFELHKRLEQIPEKTLKAFILFHNRIKVTSQL